MIGQVLTHYMSTMVAHSSVFYWGDVHSCHTLCSVWAASMLCALHYGWWLLELYICGCWLAVS